MAKKPRQIQLRIDTSSNWTTVNPTLLNGEVGVESNTGYFKIGDGSNDWTTLSYQTTLAPLKLRSYTVATLPSASTYDDSIIMVSDETGGTTPAFSDGTNWRRVADRAIVS